ncbi:MAG: glycosyltransferase family 2 protein [bacterium]
MANNNFPKVFIIVLNFNGSSVLSNCLKSIMQSDYPNFEVVLVDNNSTDSSFEQAKNDFSRFHFIKNSENIGFSRGNNIGIRFALEKFADLVFILNNDTIIDKNTISTLAKTSKQYKKSGIITPLILEGDNKKVWFAGGKINWCTMKTSHVTKVSSKKPYKSEYLSGCAMLIKKDVFKKIGLFDERFFLYYEDTDFSMRAKKAGFDLLIDPSATIQHLEQSELNAEKIYYLVISGLLFFKTHASFLQKIWLYFYILLRKIKNTIDVLAFHKPIATEVRRAYGDYKKLLN